jgi:hypothetical protein
MLRTSAFTPSIDPTCPSPLFQHEVQACFRNARRKQVAEDRLPERESPANDGLPGLARARWCPHRAAPAGVTSAKRVPEHAVHLYRCQQSLSTCLEAVAAGRCDGDSRS